LEQEDERLTIIHSGGNIGFSKGCNLGARAATGNTLLFLNPDAIPDAGAVTQMTETLAKFQSPAIVGARLLDADGTLQRGSRRGELTLMAAILNFMRIVEPRSGTNRFNRHLDPLPDKAERVPTTSGAAMMMTRSGFDQLGGFDERYFLHVEDIDLCKRARLAGGDVVFEPRAVIRHIGSTSDVSSFIVERHKAAGLVRYFWIHGGVWAPVKAMIAAGLVYPGLLLRTIMRRLTHSPSS
jgi:GT2 family glycosyltransferase